MRIIKKIETVENPCLQIEVDLSAMIDGELDAASVRRVMVHSDVCPSCNAFMDGIRVQARAHQNLHEVLNHGPDGDPDAVVEVVLPGQSHSQRVKVTELRRQLMDNRDQLARILYELGRGFVLMGLSPKFSRVVAREPVPIPDMYRRGQNLLDEVERLSQGPGVQVDGSGVDDLGGEWVRAKSLFDQNSVATPAENLTKGIQLLSESLSLSPDFHDARIYLGHAYHVAQDRKSACREYELVLKSADDLMVRSYALLNLGNVYLEEGELERATECFLELVESGAVQRSPQFGLIYFNLALAYGYQERFQECLDWLSRLYSELPHKRRMIADEFRSRHQFADLLSRHPDVKDELAGLFPCWFPLNEAC